MRHTLPLALVIAAAASCAEPAAPTLGEAPASIESCPRLICGNTPYLGAYPFWELDETGATYSTNGLRITGASYQGAPQEVHVDGFTWIRTPLGGGPSQPISGTKIYLASKDGTASFELTVNAAPSVAFYEGGNDGTPVPTYWISYTQSVNGRRKGPVNLCGNDQGSSLPRPAIVFAGDRYSSTTGALVATGAAAFPWFNVTCKEDALWKLALMRHVEAASNAAYPTDEIKRMSLLRSIRADYCGDGTPLTELGTKIDWINDGGWLFQDAVAEPESVWGPDGAVCLTKTRIEGVEVPCAEELTACDDLLADWTSHGSVLTLVPIGP